MSGLFKGLFEYLFKYPRIAYERGDVVWSGGWSPLLLVALFAVGAGLVVWSYRWSRNRVSPLATWGLVAIRATALVILTICLMRPVLVLSTAVPRQNIVAIVIDDSRSMAIQDMGGNRSRGAMAQEIFASPESDLLEELEERFLIRHFRFSSLPERLRDTGELGFQGSRTLIGRSLDFVRSELASLPLSGIVLVTDGGDQDPEALEDAILGLRAEGIAVQTVGAGRERITPDIAIERVELPRSVAQGTAVMAEVVIAYTGATGNSLTVNLEENGLILATGQVALTGSEGNVTARVPVTLDTPGIRTIRARVPALSGEVIPENNFQDAHIQVRDGRDKILYYEGQPRDEVGFLRRAVADDENLQVVSLIRTGDDRYMRYDVDSADELGGGFPRTREELFQYRGLVLGSVEASAFTPDQVRMIVDFVDRRGGTLLLLGGHRALKEGGWAGTALEPVIPVRLDSPATPRPGDPFFFAEVRVTPTRAGLTHPALLHPRPEGEDPGLPEASESDEERMARWERLPPLVTVNALGQPRPGATVLLTGVSPDVPGGEQPVLAFQRYGAGMSGVLGVHDTWVWQMDADIPLEDMTHELFWRQLLRWMVQEVPEPLQAGAVRTRVAPDEPVELVARVVSEEYLPVNDAVVTARVTDPFGAEQDVRLSWNLDRDGEFRGSFLPAAPGPYEVVVEALDGDRFLEAPALRIEAGVLDEELRSGAMRGNLLRRVANETGGEFFTLDRTDGLAESLNYTDRGTVVQEERDLWDLPIFFFLLVGLFSAEWMIRRRTGLA